MISDYVLFIKYPFIDIKEETIIFLLRSHCMVFNNPSYSRIPCNEVQHFIFQLFQVNQLFLINSLTHAFQHHSTNRNQDVFLVFSISMCQYMYLHSAVQNYETTSILIVPSGQNHADSAGNPWWRGIPGEIWVESETRIHREIEGKFPH